MSILVLKVIIVALILLNLLLLRYLFEANSILNWYIRKYNGEPRVVAPPMRSRWHRRLLALFFFPVSHTKVKA